MQVGGRQFAAHRFVLRSRQAAFYQRLCRPGAGADADVVSVDGVPADVFRLVLEFVYTGTGPLLAAGPCRLRLPQTPKPGKPPPQKKKTTLSPLSPYFPPYYCPLVLTTTFGLLLRVFFLVMGCGRGFFPYSFPYYYPLVLAVTLGPHNHT